MTSRLVQEGNITSANDVRFSNTATSIIAPCKKYFCLSLAPTLAERIRRIII
jgi:hypothetical protein